MEVKIRPLQICDAYTSVKWRNDSEVFKYTGNVYHNEITIENELEWIKKVINNDNEVRYAIIVDNEYIGNIYLTNIQNKTAEYHIFIGNKNYWGKGCAKIASELIINYAFEKLRLNNLILKVRPQNISALKLYQNLGFNKIGENENFLIMKLENQIK